MVQAVHLAIIFRFCPRLMELNLFNNSISKYLTKRDYFQYYDLNKKNYSYLKEHCQNGFHTGDFKQLKGVFTPLGISIDTLICKVIMKLGKPGYFIRHRGRFKGFYTLFYKKKIGFLHCIFEMHFYNKKLFICQVSIKDIMQEGTDEKIDLIRLLFGYDLKDDSDHDQMKSGVLNFKDAKGYSICSIEDHFSLRFILTDPDSSALNQWLAIKHNQKKHKVTKEMENEQLKKAFLSIT